MKLKHFIFETPLSMIRVGWGNGYVCLPKEHKYHGVHYDEIDVDVHGGLTFSRSAETIKEEVWQETLPKGCETSWIVGFDTAHFGDDKDGWSKAAVEAETVRLKQQLEAIN